MRSLFACGFMLLMTGFFWQPDNPAARKGAGEPGTGPQTEKRFPPLQVPAGFKATLFACDPLIEYPSVIALGPRPGTLFVANDFMTGLGHEIVRRDEIRLIEDSDGDGYADKKTVFAAGFNSIQGLAYHDGTVYVMHAPYLTALRDTKGTGKADERRDLLTGLGLRPEDDQIRLHNANGVVVGHDGWLYLALGDRGCKVVRPEGDTLLLEGGGILRCRPDGKDLHVFSTGLRNIYDVAVDADLNVFVRDNENDGGKYKIRVCHSFFGADHGYPYLYDERPDEALAPLADLGLGSSAGGVCYLEHQFPPEYRGNLFFCEWGKSVVRYQPARMNATFAALKETVFASGAANDPYGFKPTDLVVARDGSLYVSDWADGQRPRRGRGRIYQISYLGSADKNKKDAASDVARLNSESYFVRHEAQIALEKKPLEAFQDIGAALGKNELGVFARMHAVWILAKIEDRTALAGLMGLAKSDPDPRVRVQAVRALADAMDPVLASHQLDAAAPDAGAGARIAELAEGADPQVQLEVVNFLGRLRWREAPGWLQKNLKRPDAALAHAAQMTLRRSANWPAVLELLDRPDSEPIAAIARRALAEQFDKQVVDGLIERLKKDADPVRQRSYADLLTRVHRKPGPWVYWGFRPGPRPANTVTWDRTEAIEQALDRALAGSERKVRPDILQSMLRASVPARTETLADWLKDEDRAEAVASILAALSARPGVDSQPLLESILQGRKYSSANRLQAVSIFLAKLAVKDEKRLLDLAESIEDGPVLAELIRAMGSRKQAAAGPFLLGKLASMDVAVRAGALSALAELDVPQTGAAVGKMLDDADAGVRSAAATAAGRLMLRFAADRLLQLTRDPAADVRRSSLEALRRLREARALPMALKALDDRDTALKALDYLADMGGPAQATAVTDLARREPSVDMLAAVGKVLTVWIARAEVPASERQDLQRALAEIHGSSGVLLGWHLFGPVSAKQAAAHVAELTSGQSLPVGARPAAGWRLALSAGIDARLRLGPAAKEVDKTWLAFSEISLPDPLAVEFFTASSGLETVWLSDKIVYQRDKPGIIGPYPDRFEVGLAEGRNRVLVRFQAVKGAAEFQLRFRRKSASQDHERLARVALSRAGNPEQGRQIFLNAEKSLCSKCHRVGEAGERIGPELTGLGSRFSKVYIIESILEPSRTIAPSYETTAVVLKNGKVIQGIKIAESDATITLADSQVQKHTIARADIESQQRHVLSSMPDGLERRLTEDEFVDLVSFLVNLKDARAR